jgi:mRNA interferase RelE/StbE
MIYEVEFKPRALKELKNLPPRERERIVLMTAALHNNLAGDVKRLTNFTPEYRLRVGEYRILFEVEDKKNRDLPYSSSERRLQELRL